MKLSIALFPLLATALISCNGSNKQNNVEQKAPSASVADTINSIAPKYAKGFSVAYSADGVCLLDISDPQDSLNLAYHFALVKDAEKVPTLPTGYTKIAVPIKSTICMTSLQLSNFIALNALDRVKGITSSRHLFNEEINAQIKNGQTLKIGIEGNFDTELVMAINPDVIFISPFKRGGYDALSDANVPLVPHLGYKELTPLGQAEWIKFIALFTGQENEANALFSAIEKRYNDLKLLAANQERRPTVLSGEMRGGNWYAVGGQSFLAQLFRDAGAEYFLTDDKSSGGKNIDYETVYSLAADADYWRIVNSFNGRFSYDALKASDERYADFKAWKEHKVIYCNMKQTPFYEKMPVQPDVVLADLIHIFHPSLLPDHVASYYSLLNE